MTTTQEACRHGYWERTAWDSPTWVSSHKYWCSDSPLPEPNTQESNMSIDMMRDTADELELDFTTTYSGRGMFGATCVGVSGPVWRLTNWWAALPAVVQAELGEPRSDNMGMDLIWYWPWVSAS